MAKVQKVSPRDFKQEASHPGAPHLLHRDVTATEPNSKWVTDVTSVPTTQGWLSLAVILDVYSRDVVGWAMSASCDEEVVENALHMAGVRRRPKAGLVHHSDRGGQDTSRAYRRRASASWDGRESVAQRPLLGQCRQREFLRFAQRGVRGEHDLSIT